MCSMQHQQQRLSSSHQTTTFRCRTTGYAARQSSRYSRKRSGITAIPTQHRHADKSGFKAQQVIGPGGLLSIANLNEPFDLHGILQKAEIQCSKLLDSASSITPGAPALHAVAAVETAIQDVLRPARYIVDFHPDAGWSSAAASALQAAKALQSQLYSSIAVRHLILQTEQVLQAGLTNQDTQSTHDQSYIESWLRVTRYWKPKWQRSHQHSTGDITQTIALLEHAERECSSSLRTVLLCPAAAPRLVITSEQAQFLAPLLPADVIHEVNQNPPDSYSQLADAHGIEPLLPNEYDNAASEVHTIHGPATEPELALWLQRHAKLQPRKLRLAGSNYLNLSTLDLLTEGALLEWQNQLAGTDNSMKSQQGNKHRLYVLYLTRNVMHTLLAETPNEGIRWEVYHSGVVPLCQVMRVAVDHLVKIRNQLANLKGYESHAHIVLDNSLLGHPHAAIMFLQQVESALRPVASEQLQQMAKISKRNGIFIKQPQPVPDSNTSSQSMPHSDKSQQAATPFLPNSACAHQVFNSWDVDFVRQLYVEEQQASSNNRRRVATAYQGWQQYNDYFTLGSVLKGMQALCSKVLGVEVVSCPLTQADKSWLLSTSSAVAIDQQSARGQSSTKSSGPIAANRLPMHPGMLNDLLLRFEVVTGNPPQQAQQDVSGSASPDCILYLHVHSNTHELPFATLLSPGSDQTGSHPNTLHSIQPAVVLLRVPLSIDTDVGPVEIPPGSSAEQVAELLLLSRLQHRFTNPLHLNMLLHEFGHVLQYLLSSSTTFKDHQQPSNRAGVGDRPQQPRLPRQLLSAQHWALEWRECAAHVVERWARQPASLRLMSSHVRLGVPLPPHDAVRCASLTALTALPGGFYEIWEHSRAALHDILLYTSPLQSSTRNQDEPEDCDNGIGNHEIKSKEVDTHFHESSIQERQPALPADLSTLAYLEQQAVLGGAQWVYVLARFLAAGAWKATGLEQDPLCPVAGKKLRELLLQKPAFSSELDVALCDLLSDPDAFVNPLHAVPSASMPNLTSDCWQDTDVAG